MNESFKFSRYENSFIWLNEAGVALPVYCAQEPVIPLLLSKSTNLFKLFSSDVGLLASMYADGIQLKILNKEKDMNFGAIYENAIEPIKVTPLGITILVNPLQPSNAHEGICFTFSPIVILFNLVHSLNSDKPAVIQFSAAQ